MLHESLLGIGQRVLGQDCVEVVALSHFLSVSHSINSFLVWEVFLPLYIYIVSQAFRLVNTFFEISQTFFGKGVGSAPSIHGGVLFKIPVPSAASLVYYLYSGEVGRPKPLWGKEWRLYRSYTHLCDLLPTHLRRVTSVHPARKRFPPYCIFIVPHRERIVKTFFKLFSSFFHLAFWRLAPLPWDNYSIANGYPNCNRQNTQITGFLHPHLCALYILTKLLAAWYNGNSAQGARPRAANYSTLSIICQA
jgi:hypothetical protein